MKQTTDRANDVETGSQEEVQKKEKQEEIKRQKMYINIYGLTEREAYRNLILS